MVFLRLADAGGGDDAGAAVGTKPRKDSRMYGEAGGASRGGSAAVGELSVAVTVVVAVAVTACFRWMLLYTSRPRPDRLIVMLLQAYVPGRYTAYFV